MPAQKLVVLRFSAMGDVAMVASVLRELAQQNDVEIVMVSRKPFAPFFADIPKLTFHAIDPKGRHKGVVGLYRLFKELKTFSPSGIADLHDNIRSHVISALFRMVRTTVIRIDKGRREKKELTRESRKKLRQLKPTVERYADVFKKFGLTLQLSYELKRDPKPLPATLELPFKRDSRKIGISPFAQHPYKVYNLAQMEQVIEKLNNLGFQVFIFGGGDEEKVLAQAWSHQFPRVYNLIGKFSLTQELAIISNLDVMLSMDSSGMHMASLMGIPVVSIWGPTHPYAGFLGYGQAYADCLQIDAPNRPNSVYGNKPCLCGVQPCIDLITPQAIVDKLLEKLSHG